MSMYSNVDIEKFGDVKSQNSAGHNLRQIPSDNVNPKKSHLNNFYVGSANMNFNQVLASKLSVFKLRKNAVKSVNLVFSASPELFKDKAKGLQWEKQTFEFIKAEFGVDNIVYAVVHHDEKTPHMQVSVIPVDPNGKLNASHFFDGRKKCGEFTTRYNQAVKNLGLLRDKGKKKSKPGDTKEFYRKVNESVEFDKKVDMAVKSLEKKIDSSSKLGFIRTFTAKKLFSTFYDVLKRYKAKSLADEKKLKEAEKIKQENDDLKLKFDNLGLSHTMKFSECAVVKNQIAEGMTAIAERQATALNVVKNDVQNLPAPIQEKSKFKHR